MAPISTIKHIVFPSRILAIASYVYFFSLSFSTPFMTSYSVLQYPFSLYPLGTQMTVQRPFVPRVGLLCLHLQKYLSERPLFVQIKSIGCLDDSSLHTLLILNWLSKSIAVGFMVLILSASKSKEQEAMSASSILQGGKSFKVSVYLVSLYLWGTRQPCSSSWIHAIYPLLSLPSQRPEAATMLFSSLLQ
jgi:hypothetical protein